MRSHKGGFVQRLRRCAVILALAYWLWAPTTVWAQRAARLPGDDAGWLQWLIALVLIVLSVGAAFLNPKRSHLT